jgi:hypothetical protein
MIKDLLSLNGYLTGKSGPKETTYSNISVDKNFSGTGAVTLGAQAMGGNRMFGTTKGGTFDYLSTAENTIDCYYQKIEDLKYYESHDLTEKVIGLFRDYINQLWKEGSNLLDIPGEDPKLVEELNAELEGMDILEILTKDMDDVMYYGSVTYEISDNTDKKKKKGDDDDDKLKADNVDKQERNIDVSKDAPADRKYDFGPLRESRPEFDDFDFYNNVAQEREYAETLKANAKRLVDAYAPNVQGVLRDTAVQRPAIRDLIEGTRPANARGTEQYRNSEVADSEAPADAQDKISDIRSRVPYKSQYKLNKVKFPHHTVIEHHREEGRRYLIKANAQYHLPTDKHSIFYYGNDSMRIMEAAETKARGKSAAAQASILDLAGMQSTNKTKEKEYKNLGIDPKDPKKKPTKYELLNRELSAAVPLFYHHLPKVRELYLKDLVLSILGIKDVIQPDVLAMNFDGGMDIDQAQDMCNNLEDLLNKNSDYSIFNSASLDYNQLVKLLVDTVRILPDIEGKIQSLNPVRTTSLQDKISQIRMEYQELNRNIISALGVPMDLFEGNSSKWEVIKRSERLQSKVNYYINTIKLSVRRLAQSIFFKKYGRELKLTDFKVTIFNESDLELAAKTNRLQSLNELSQTLLQIVGSAERELADSQLVNKRAYYKLLLSGLKEVYPEIDDLLDIDKALGPEGGPGSVDPNQGVEDEMAMQ